MVYLFVMNMVHVCMQEQALSPWAALLWPYALSVGEGGCVTYFFAQFFFCFLTSLLVSYASIVSLQTLTLFICYINRHPRPRQTSIDRQTDINTTNQKEPWVAAQAATMMMTHNRTLEACSQQLDSKFSTSLYKNDLHSVFVLFHAC